MWQIKKTILEDLMVTAHNYLPDEFLCFLGGNKKEQTIEEVVILPTWNGKTSSSINLHSFPMDDTIIGSFHSHPNGVAMPSRADLKFFRRFDINIILSLPIREFAFFDKQGQANTIKIID